MRNYLETHLKRYCLSGNKGIIRDKSKADNKSRDILLSAYYQWLLSGDRVLIFIYLNRILTV